MKGTVFVTLTDRSYLGRAQRTIRELRTHGEWTGDVVCVCVDFTPTADDFASLGVTPRVVPHIDHQPLWDAWKTHPIKRMDDNRHYAKVYQWDKLYTCDGWWRERWERMIFLDAGLRVCTSVAPLLEVPWRGAIVAPDDTTPTDPGKRLQCQYDLKANPSVTEQLYNVYGRHWLDSNYFLNCMYIVDTAILSNKLFGELVGMMYRWPISCCNEMGIMNLAFVVDRCQWRPLPARTADGKRFLFGWNESDFKPTPTWRQFCLIKYSSTMPGQ